MNMQRSASQPGELFPHRTSAPESGPPGSWRGCFVYDLDADLCAFIRMDTPEWGDLKDWLRAHLIDPDPILLDPPIAVSHQRRFIRYSKFEPDPDGPWRDAKRPGGRVARRDVTEQTEGLWPWPDSIRALLDQEATAWPTFT